MALVEWRSNEGKLRVDDVIKLPGGDIGVVTVVTPSSAQIYFHSRHDKPITTRKGVTKIVSAHRLPTYISVNSVVLIADPTSEYAKRIREHIMSEAAVQEAAAEPKEKKARAVQVYTRTEKTPEKEMRGQGALVLAKITELGSGTIPQVAEALRGQFVNSRQSEERVVGFYLSKFKREGFVTSSGGSATETDSEAADQPE